MEECPGARFRVLNGCVTTRSTSFTLGISNRHLKFSENFWFFSIQNSSGTSSTNPATFLNYALPICSLQLAEGPS
jgi:hypothetical protein